MFVPTIDTCASIKRDTVANVSCGPRVEWLFTAQPLELRQEVLENKQMAVPVHEQRRSLWCQALDLGECETQENWVLVG